MNRLEEAQLLFHGTKVAALNANDAVGIVADTVEVEVNRLAAVDEGLANSPMLRKDVRYFTVYLRSGWKS